MVETTDTRDSYEINDFSAVNQFIDDEKKFAQSFRSKIRAAYIRMGLMSLSIFIVCLGVFLLLAAYAYHIYKSEKVIEKVIVEERVIMENSPKVPFKEIESNRDFNDTNNVTTGSKDQVKKDYYIFSSQTFIDTKNIEQTVHTGNVFKKNEYDKPYHKFCYVDVGFPPTKISLYSDSEKLTYDSSYRSYISSTDFQRAQGKCLMNEY